MLQTEIFPFPQTNTRPSSFVEDVTVKMKSNKMFVQNYKFGIMFVFVALKSVFDSVEANTGSTYWKPRLRSILDYIKIRPGSLIKYANLRALQLTDSSQKKEKHKVTKDNIKKGLVVLIDVYSFGIAVVSVASTLTWVGEIDDVDPLSAPYYTRAYRWLLRHFDAYPNFFKGRKGYALTHQLWDKRSIFNDKYIPKWVRTILLPFISEKKWKREEEHENLFKEAWSEFGKDIQKFTDDANTNGSRRYLQIYHDYDSDANNSTGVIFRSNIGEQNKNYHHGSIQQNEASIDPYTKTRNIKEKNDEPVVSTITGDIHSNLDDDIKHNEHENFNDKIDHYDNIYY